MTLQQFMIAYQENRRDIFVLHYSNYQEICRIGMAEYFTDYDIKYGDNTVSEFVIGVVDAMCLVISIYLDLECPHEAEE